MRISFHHAKHYQHWSELNVTHLNDSSQCWQLKVNIYEQVQVQFNFSSVYVLTLASVSIFYFAVMYFIVFRTWK